MDCPAADDDPECRSQICCGNTKDHPCSDHYPARNKSSSKKQGRFLHLSGPDLEAGSLSAITVIMSRHLNLRPQAPDSIPDHPDLPLTI